MYPIVPDERVELNYDLARARYKAFEVDVDLAMEKLAATPISIQCWQGDDGIGFEKKDGHVAGGGIMATGNHPGRARCADELRADAGKAISLIPGAARFNLHAIYAETGDRLVPRDELSVEHFDAWIQWAKSLGIKLDFNPTFYAHPLANDGYTLSHPNARIRAFWVRHGIASRRIAESMARQLGGCCVVNHWMPDGCKDSPVDRWGPRRRLMQSLDEVFAATVDTTLCRDFVECKLFGLGSEDYVVGSHEFYMAYAVSRNRRLCLDMGHFHPTESVADKLSAILSFQDEVLLHVSRGVRWDSDHVVILNDEVRNVFTELARGGPSARHASRWTSSTPASTASGHG